MNLFSIFSIQNQYHLTQDFTDIKKKDIKFHFKQICDYLLEKKISCIYCKIFLQDLSLLDDLIVAFKRTGQDPILIPLEYQSVSGSVMSGIHLFGIHSDELNKFEHTTTSGGGCVCYTYRGLRYYHGKYAFQNSFDAFAFCQSSLLRCGLNPTTLIRTWFYLDHIFKNYSDFNVTRNNFFDTNGICYDRNSPDLPASTCIEGSFSGKHIMQLYAVDLTESNAVKRRIYNILQNEAEGDQYLYQPAFSRAMLLDNGCHVELQISGTASIGVEGKTLYENNPYQQIRTTLKNVFSLLQEAGMSWEHLCECTMFFTNANMYGLFKKACDDLQIEHPKGVRVISHVCRKNLLFEMDGIAKRNKGNRNEI
ncbi:hypothetical protein IMSAG013_00781 [Clostridiales bacterium]|nr:hypothetical protein IMSAG013_00781 [Clostridiales bacterium]